MHNRRAALLTGSATGVGAATALQLAHRGWDVVVNYSRSAEESQASAAACRAAGADVLVQQADVSDDAQCRALVDATVQRWGRLDALVNNAGTSVFGDAARWDAIDGAVFQKLMAVNVAGPFQMVRAAQAHLREAKGCVVNVSSMAGVSGVGSSLPYVASKGALNTMTLALARSLAPDIRVNAVCPGLITSRWFVKGMGQDGFERVKQGYEKEVPLETSCTPEDVAEAIVWLVEGARTVTGELLMLDSGSHLGRRAPR